MNKLGQQVASIIKRSEDDFEIIKGLKTNHRKDYHTHSENKSFILIHIRPP